MVWYSLSKISIEKLVQYFKDADYTWIILGVSLGMLSHISRAYRWLFMVEPLGFRTSYKTRDYDSSVERNFQMYEPVLEPIEGDNDDTKEIGGLTVTPYSQKNILIMNDNKGNLFKLNEKPYNLNTVSEFKIGFSI